ncbi:hypothetical protein D3C80_940100 [compost metagenome]
MGFRAVIAFIHQFLLHGGNDIAVFGMDERQRAKLGAARERGEHLVIVDHQRALVGHEMLEGVDAFFLNHRLHFVEDLLAPPGDCHMEGIVAMRAGRLVVPTLQGIQHGLAGIGKTEIDHHGRAAGKGCAGAAIEIVGGIGTHEGHFEVNMRIDTARHDITAGGVERFVARKVRADLDDLSAVYLQIRLVGQVGGNDGSVLDYCGHGCSPYWLF